MLLRLSLAISLFAALLSAQAPRTEADTQALEARVDGSPEDLTSRVALIRFYGLTRPASMPADRLRALRRKHIVWMIEHHPDHMVLSERASMIDKSGNALADPDGWAEADAAWRKLFARPAPDAGVFANAIFFYKTSDPAFARRLAADGLRAYPGNAVLAGARGTLLAYTILGVRLLDQYDRATSFDDALANGEDAARARRELESSREAALAGSAAQVLHQQQFPLTSHQRTAQAKDAAELSEHLYQRAIELDPDNMRWKSGLMNVYQYRAASARAPAEKVGLMEKAAALAPNDSSLTYALPDLADAYLAAGDLKKASETANRLLDLASHNAGGNYGGAVHTGNIVLGRVALKQSNLEEAKTRLLAAGRTPGSPVLNSFGPNWILAQELLGHGERDTVLAYIDLCRVFWKMGSSRLDSWAATLRAGGSPSFSGGSEIAQARLAGKPAPDFRLKSLAGGEVSLSQFKGKVVLIDFWATWCAPCRAEMPAFEKLHREFAAKDVAILALDANEPEDTVDEYIKKEKFTFPVLLSEGTDVIAKYGVNAYPTVVAVDKSGRVADVLVGSGSDNDSRLRGAIEKARAGAPPAPPEPPAPAPTVSGAVSAAVPAAAPLPPAVTADDFYRDGVRMRGARDFAGALAAFTEAIRLDPKRASTYNERGLAYSNSGRHADALPDYSRSIELGPTSGVYNNRGWAYLELGKMEEAKRDLDKAIELGPANETALGNRSRWHTMRKQYAEAIADCDAALRLNPKSTWAAARRAEAQRLLAGGAPVQSLAAPKLLSPDAGAVFDHYPRQTTLVWTEVPAAASYMVEWDYKSGDTWTAEARGTEGPAFPARQPVFSFQFVGAQPGRWRVWAVDTAGYAGAKSEWREFRYTR